MKTRIAALRLGAFALVSTAVACAVTYKAADAFIEHRKLSADVARMEHEYSQQLQQLGTVLSEESKLRNDAETQRQMLIDRFGYTRPDETPIIILDEE